jgi:N-sulfoglucosamine sulfohydrolase
MRIPALLAALLCLTPSASAGADRPNFVFIAAEDISPDLGCYGSRFVHTPNLDRLASQGARFTRCFTHAPVCAPSRSGMITGMYPTSFGTHHMRSKLNVPPPPPTFTSILRSAGYHVAWPGKTDFNFDVPAGAFSTTKPWMKQGPGSLPKPCFAFVNINVTHESKIRSSAEEYAQLTQRLTPAQRVDPGTVVLPPYYPDTPEVRRDVANYFELITAMDYVVGDVLRQIDEQGLAESTVVMFWGDHGWGMPRGKRWVYDSGSRCPLIVRWPGKIKPGTVREDLVAVVDFAPTFLTMAGLDVPARLQGHTILTAQGDGNPEPRKYVYSARDRMDETPDRIRSVRDQRFRYIRNFHPELPYAQRIQYMDQMPTMRAWRRLNAEGKLRGAQTLFFAPTKPAEELYDTQADPHEVENLIKSTKPEHLEKLKELRAALDAWIEQTGDLGAVPEEELVRRGVVKDVLSKYEERKAP